MEPNEVVEKAKQDAIANAIVAKDSNQVGDVLLDIGNGIITQYGEQRRGGSRATRTEIKVRNGKVVIHKNCGQGSGVFTAVARFDKVEIFPSEECSQPIVISIGIDPLTSPFNPIYNFSSDGEFIGSGWGQTMDLAIAESLTRIQHLSDNQVSMEVINWIQSKIE